MHRIRNLLTAIARPFSSKEPHARGLTTQRLVFESETIFLSALDETLYEGKVSDWDIREEFNPDSPGREYPDGIGSYTLRLSTDVRSLEELHVKWEEAWKLTNKLDQAWVYATAYPLFRLRFKPRLVVAPDHWSTNYEELNREFSLAQYGMTATVRAVSHHYIQGGFMPLRSALEVLKKVENAPNEVQTLIGFHYRALKTGDIAARYFFYSKGLELARGMLPAGSQHERGESLPKDLTDQLRRDFGWLFDICNNRMDVRHVVRNPETLELHPRLSAEEAADFLADADTLLRGIVSWVLGIGIGMMPSPPKSA